jgi:hypothetical protein
LRRSQHTSTKCARAKTNAALIPISDALPFGLLCYGEPNAIGNAEFQRRHYAIFKKTCGSGGVRVEPFGLEILSGARLSRRETHCQQGPGSRCGNARCASSSPAQILFQRSSVKINLRCFCHRSTETARPSFHRNFVKQW